MVEITVYLIALAMLIGGLIGVFIGHVTGYRQGWTEAADELDYLYDDEETQ